MARLSCQLIDARVQAGAAEAHAGAAEADADAARQEAAEAHALTLQVKASRERQVELVKQTMGHKISIAQKFAESALLKEQMRLLVEQRKRKRAEEAAEEAKTIARVAVTNAARAAQLQAVVDKNRQAKNRQAKRARTAEGQRDTAQKLARKRLARVKAVKEERDGLMAEVQRLEEELNDRAAAGSPSGPTPMQIAAMPTWRPVRGKGRGAPTLEWGHRVAMWEMHANETPPSAIGKNIVAIVKRTAPWLNPIEPHVTTVRQNRFELRIAEEAMAGRRVAEACASPPPLPLLFPPPSSSLPCMAAGVSFSEEPPSPRHPGTLHPGRLALSSARVATVLSSPPALPSFIVSLAAPSHVPCLAARYRVRQLGFDETTKFQDPSMVTSVTVEPTEGAAPEVVILRAAYATGGGTSELLVKVCPPPPLAPLHSTYPGVGSAYGQREPHGCVRALPSALDPAPTPAARPAAHPTSPNGICGAALTAVRLAHRPWRKSASRDCARTCTVGGRCAPSSTQITFGRGQIRSGAGCSGWAEAVQSSATHARRHVARSGCSLRRWHGKWRRRQWAGRSSARLLCSSPAIGIRRCQWAGASPLQSCSAFGMRRSSERSCGASLHACKPRAENWHLGVMIYSVPSLAGSK